MTGTGGDEREPVLWLVRGLGLGGAEKLLALHASSGDHERFRYHAAYTVPGKTHFVPALEAEGVAVHRLPGAAWQWPLAVRRLVDEQAIRVVHAHSPALAAVARLVARTLPAGRRPAVITTEHNHWRSFHPFTRWANAVTYALDAHTFAVSEEVRASVRRSRRDAVEVLVHGIAPRGVDVGPGTRDRVRGELGLEAGTFLALTVANFRREKAHDDLLTAAATVTRDDPRIRFVLVGQGPLAADVRRRRDELGLQHAVMLLGLRDDVPALLAAADAFVLPSRWEGFPIAVMEALAAGLPVVATGVGGVTSVVTDGVHGRLVPPGSPELLARALLDVAADPAAHEAMAAAALARAPEFDVRRAVVRIEQVYCEVAARPVPAGP